MKFLSFSNILNGFLSVAKRFPLCLLLVLIFYGLLQYQISSNAITKNIRNPLIERLMVTAFLGALSYLGMYTWSESWQLDKTKKLVLFMVNGLGLVLLYFMLPAGELFSLQWKSTYIIIGLSIFFHLFISYIPYIKHHVVQDFWVFNKSLLLRFLEATFFAGAIFFGLLLALLALDQLFGFDIGDKDIMRLFTFAGGLFHPLYFLSQYPEKYYAFDQDRPSKSYMIFCKYIILPIVGLYFVILYAYGIKIGVSWDLPRGLISHLVLWFSVIGILAYLLNYYNDRFDDSLHIRWFKRWYFYILLPLMGLVFLALYVRITDYGITEPRYILMMTAIWLTILSLYFIFSSKDDIRFIPVSLSVVVLISVLGPWSMKHISIRSQKNELIKVLSETRIIDKGGFTTMPDNVNNKNSGRIVNILYFLERRNALNFLQSYNNANLSLDSETPVSTIRQRLKLDTYADPGSYENEYFNFNATPNSEMKIDGSYDYLVSFSHYRNAESTGEIFITFEEQRGVIYRNDMEVCSFSALDLLREFETYRSESEGEQPVPYNLSCDGVAGVLVFDNISIEKVNTKIQSANGMALLRFK